MSKSRKLLAGTALALIAAAPAFAEGLGLGRPALPEEIAAWDVAVLPDGTGLPPGSGDVETGDEVFADACAACHGDFAEGIDNWPVLAGGRGTLTDQRPVKTVGSYWPHLSTAWDYVHRSMPFGSAQTLSVDEVYAITAFLLYSNGIVEDDFVLTHENFTEIVLPNADGFYVDDRPETEYPQFSAAPCMENCREAPQITKRAIDLGVTPTDPDGRPAGTVPPLLLAAAAPTAATPEAPEDAAPAVMAAADPALVEAGERVFRKCAACHKVGDGARNGTGPHLNNVVGQAAAHAEGFRYSKPLSELAAGGLVWDESSLHAFLENPRSFMRGTAMAFAGLRDEAEREAVIAYLASFTE
jgi:S-disulfanyl-L-cysteine oxidoreductase SoxD